MSNHRKKIREHRELSEYMNNSLEEANRILFKLYTKVHEEEQTLTETDWDNVQSYPFEQGMYPSKYE